MSMVRYSAIRRALAVLPLSRLAMNAQSSSPRFVLWVDAVGAFLVCTSDEVKFGQAVADARVDVPLVADVARHHVTIRRDAEGYVVDPRAETWLDDRRLQSAAALGDPAALRMGPVRLRVSRPHPLSATARVEVTSGHRLSSSCDAVLLLAQSCVMGPKPGSHVVCPDWPRELVLFYAHGKLTCHMAGQFEIDGRQYNDYGPLTLASRVAGDGFSFSLEGV
jgi:hypothetical protein